MSNFNLGAIVICQIPIFARSALFGMVSEDQTYEKIHSALLNK